MARPHSRHPLVSRASRLALAGLLVTGWSVVALSVTAPAQAAIIVAEDPAPVDAPADAPADNTAPDAPADSGNSQTDTSSSKPHADSSHSATDDPTDNPSEDPTDNASSGSSDEPTDNASDQATDEPTDAASDEASAEPDPMTSDGAEVTDSAGAASVALQISGSIGSPAAGTPISVSAQGLMPNSHAALWIFSSPLSLGESTADDAGNLTMSASIPAGLEAGTHTVVLEAVDADGAPVESATQIVIAADGTIAGITENASTDGLDIPELASDPMSPAYPVVVALDDPGFVANSAVTALTLVTVAGVGLSAAAGAGRGSVRSSVRSGGTGGPSGGGLDAAVRSRSDELDEVGEYFVRGRARLGLALAGLSGTLPRVSPLLARIVGDATPLRAFAGNLSFLLPLASLVLGILAASSVGGIAEPAAAAFMLPLMVIGVFDGLAGVIGAVAFAAVVALSGGIVGASSVRSLIGVGLVIAGPGIIASSFRDIRRIRTVGSAAAWERITDLVVVPLIGAWTTIAIVSALPSLGGAAFPIADQARLFGLVALVTLVAKVLIEEAAARWVPARMRALSPAESAEPGTAQQVISALVRTGVFLFVAAAFVGNVWQLWVAAALFLLPGILALIAHVFPNSPRLWQILPEGIPLFTVMLIIGLIVTTVVKSIRGESPDFAQMSFLWMAVPGFLLALLGLTGREPREGDVRWYMRPSMTAVYRIGGIIVLVIAVVLALRG
jgi:hypothetical protein